MAIFKLSEISSLASVLNWTHKESKERHLTLKIIIQKIGIEFSKHSF
jgi:hypothetical protein